MSGLDWSYGDDAAPDALRGAPLALPGLGRLGPAGHSARGAWSARRVPGTHPTRRSGPRRTRVQQEGTAPCGCCLESGTDGAAPRARGRPRGGRPGEAQARAGATADPRVRRADRVAAARVLRGGFQVV